MRGSATLLGIACLLAFGTASAGTVYRCDTADGGRSYSSKRTKGAQCTAVSQYRAERPRAPISYSAPAPVQGPAAASSGAVGGATPASPVAGSPVTVETISTPAASAASGGGARRLVQGQVYSYIKDGVRHYTSRKPVGVANATSMRTIRYSYMETCFACSARPGVNFGKIRLNTDAYRDEITAAASEFGVDEAVVRAIIHAESAFNPNALSRVGAQGLMQLMPATARRFGVGNAFEPSQNIRGGVRYLAWLLKRFKGDLTLAAAGYNAGEGAVDKYRGVPPYSETQRYVVRVAQLAERYRGVSTTSR